MTELVRVLLKSRESSIWGLIFLMMLGSCGNQDYTLNELKLPVISPPSQIAIESGPELLNQLGCTTCHGNADDNTVNQVSQFAPRLDNAGLRYNLDYLISYLQEPQKVRNHIGSARMPDFQFSHQESRALSQYLGLQQREVSDMKFPTFKIDNSQRAIAKGEQLFGKLACISCHSVSPDQSPVVSSLSNTGKKLNQEWLMNFLAFPSGFVAGEEIMPNYFYEKNESGDGLNALYNNSAQMVSDLAAYLMTLKKEDDQLLQTDIADEKGSGIDLTEKGRMIYQGQNCAACHISPSNGNWMASNAPAINDLSQRVNVNWLRDFLQKPSAVRPFGFIPGSGSRMPDFNLSEYEVEVLASTLHINGPQKSPGHQLSKFSMNKTRRLIEDKLSCIGCHQLYDEGGQIGPDLTSVSARLTNEYIQAIVTNPGHVNSELIMPRIPMPDDVRSEVVGYLIQNDQAPITRPYLSLIDHNIILDFPDGVEGRYNKYCASCHGLSGGGDGFNAKYLPVIPTDHSDADQMANRPDDTLFDGIHSGGYILNKSNTMPPWSGLFSMEEMKELVLYIRTLCNCQGPEWSRDNKINSE